ncbi:LRR receptor-like serine/threonine-protein kinase GSO2 [Rhododendron vialii]|uniref:LRR receptor-like serine/threonine-protein kinase GSO2 n=1 Tax=Rhododendron vialii TaxID=182163 RepID=UPI00265FA3B3|nr:LRR receptor-like serine/threonine-protein kinase GSO2 [Rhododendron vialii]
MELRLSNCKLHGSISSSLWNLTQIIHLDLSFNNFSGILPSPISNLRNLAYLDLSDNNLTGPLFSFGANLIELWFLDVSNNSLTGPLPSIVPPNLRVLDIGRNLLDNTIPSWVFELPKLRYLDLSYNKLIGHTLVFETIPKRNQQNRKLNLGESNFVKGGCATSVGIRALVPILTMVGRRDRGRGGRGGRTVYVDEVCERDEVARDARIEEEFQRLRAVLEMVVQRLEALEVVNSSRRCPVQPRFPKEEEVSDDISITRPLAGIISQGGGQW